MQSIIFYAAAHEALGVCRDYANAQTVRLPSIVRGSQVTFRLRLFATAENPVPYPMSELEKIVAWKFVMDNDFDEATTCKLEAQNDQIAVSSVTENIDGTDFEFTEIAIPMLSLNTSELIAYMGSSETVTLNSELVGKDADGNDAFILQLKGYSIRNRIAGAGDPTPLPSGFGEAEVRALIAAGFDVQSEVVSNGVKVRLRAKNSTGAWGDPILIPSGNTPEIRNGYWYLNGTNTGVLAEAKSASPNAVGKLADRPSAPSDGFCYLDSENSDFYWYIGGRWTAAVHLTSVEGPQGVQGEQGIPGAVWLPSVDADGLLTYKQVAHDSEEIPRERNIRGPQGKTGAQGPQGVQGKEGKQGPVGPAGDGLAIDMADTMANRYKYDSAPMGFRFLATDWMSDEDGRRYQYWYMKKSDAQGDWSGAAVLYCGKTGAQGPQGEIGPRGFQGARGENAAVVPDVEFIGAKDEEHPETPFVFGGSITVKGTKPIAQVELYNEAGLGVSIERGDSIGTTNCMIVTDYKNSETTVYFGTDLDLSRGGRIRFAQGIGGVSPYQQWLDEGNEGSFADFIGLWHSHANKATLDKITESIWELLSKFGVDKNGKLIYDGQLVNLGDKSDPVTPDDPTDAKIYYGYVMATDAVYKVSELTADMLSVSTVQSVKTAAMDKTSLGDNPAGALVFVAIPKAAGMRARKFDGIGGYVEFEPDNGAAGTGANGAEITLNGTTYLIYGEFALVDGEYFVKVEEN